MNFDDYQEAAKETAFYPRTHALIYPALGLASEAGEVAGKVKKEVRDGRLDHDALCDEVGDCLWYLALLAEDLGERLDDIAAWNIAKLRDRQRRDVLGGDGDKR